MKKDFETFDEFYLRMEDETTYFDPYIKLIDFKFDGRKHINLHDKAGMTLAIKFSLAKKIMPELLIIRHYLGDYVDVDTVLKMNEIWGANNEQA